MQGKELNNLKLSSKIMRYRSLKKCLISSLTCILSVSGFNLINGMLPVKALALAENSFLIAQQRLVNTCENEMTSRYNPFSGRVERRMELVCRPRLRFEDIDYECDQNAWYQSNPSTGQVGMNVGQDCAPNPDNVQRPNQPVNQPSQRQRLINGAVQLLDNNYDSCVEQYPEHADACECATLAVARHYNDRPRALIRLLSQRSEANTQQLTEIILDAECHLL